MKKINMLLRKCKSLSRQLARSSSYSNSRTKSTREGHIWVVGDNNNNQDTNIIDDDNREIKSGDHQKSATIFVGSAKKRYIISTEYLSHPLFEALLNKSSKAIDHSEYQTVDDSDRDRVLVIKCEVVLFDHLLWMLENADPISLGHNSESLEELAALYVF